MRETNQSPHRKQIARPLEKIPRTDGDPEPSAPSA